MLMELNEKQKDALKQLRPLVSDVVRKDRLQNDAYLLRWLRARNYDIQKTEKMIRESMKWRIEYDADNILRWYETPEIITKYHPVQLIGFDKENSPIWINKIGVTDIKGFLQCLTFKQFYTQLVYNAESCEKQMEEQTEKFGKLVEAQYCILDMEGLSVSQIAFRDGLDMIRQMCLLYDLNYPETLKRIVIVNAAGIFPLAFSLVKPFISDETAKKIEICGRAGWRDVLLKDIDPEVLPEYYGGTKTDGSGDPRCPNLIPLGGEIPSEHFQTLEKKLTDIEGVVSEVIDSRSTKSIELRVTQCQSRISWVFGTQNHDIAFALYRKTDTGLCEQIPKERIKCHAIPAEGEFECYDTGTYVIQFDNSHSIFRSKKITYKIEVLPPLSKK